MSHFKEADRITGIEENIWFVFTLNYNCLHEFYQNKCFSGKKFTE